mgnify:CR=1 FL=1
MADLDGTEWGRVLEKIEYIEKKVDKLDDDFTTMRGTMNKGWGMLVGIAAVLGLFLNEIIGGFKKLLGMG